MPENFNKWASLNQDRIARAEQRGTLPYFVRDNRERVKQAVKQGDVLMEKVGHKTGLLISVDKKLSSAVHSVLDKQVLATLSDAQKENASKVAEILKIQLGKPMSFKDLDEYEYWPDKSKDHAPMSPLWRISFYDEFDTYYHKSGATDTPKILEQLVDVLKNLK